MQEYGIGGTEVRQDASEAISDIPKNRSLFIQKLTDDEPLKPEVVYDLKSVGEVFEHFKPKVQMEFSGMDGQPVQEELNFSNVGDFGIKEMTHQSKFLNNLNIQQELFSKMVKQLKTNKVLQKALDDPNAKNALIGSIKSMMQELEDSTVK